MAKNKTSHTMHTTTKQVGTREFGGVDAPWQCVYMVILIDHAIVAEFSLDGFMLVFWNQKLFGAEFLELFLVPPVWCVFCKFASGLWSSRFVNYGDVQFLEHCFVRLGAENE